MPLFVLLAVLGIAAFFYSRSASAQGNEMSLRDIFNKWGGRYGVDPLLLEAHAMEESELDANAVHWNPPSDISVGLMQVLYIPSDISDVNSAPKNHFNVEGWSEATFDKLKDPDFNVRIAAQIVAWNIRTYGMPRAIAVYNQYTARFSGINGPFPNADYVAIVSRNYARLKGEANV